MTPLNWYALTTAPQKERAAEHILKILHVEAFVPVVEKQPRLRKRHLGKAKPEPKRYPMVSSYVFARFPGSVPFHRLDDIHVITSVVGFEGRPFVIPDDAMDRMMALSADAPPWRAAPNPHQAFQAGETVHILDGHYLEGHTLPIKEISGGLARFLVKLMGKEHTVSVPLRYCEAA